MTDISSYYLSFCRMKQLVVVFCNSSRSISTPPGCDTTSLQGFPPVFSLSDEQSFIHLGGERLCESKESFPRIQHSFPSWGSNQEHSICSPRIPSAHQPQRHCTPHRILVIVNDYYSLCKTWQNENQECCNIVHIFVNHLVMEQKEQWHSPSILNIHVPLLVVV